MARESTRITDRTAAILPVGTHTDVIQNLALVVGTSGLRAWKWRGRVEGRRQAAKITLGHFPAMSLDQARQAASDLNGRRAEALGSFQRRQGKFRREGGQLTCDEAHRRYMEVMRAKLDEHGRKLAPRYLAEKERIWSKQLSPHIGTISVHSVTRSDVAAAVHKIVAASAKNHALTEAKVFFNWCCHDPELALDSSPTAYLKKPHAVRIRRRVFDPRGNEIVSFLKAIDLEDEDTRDAFLLLLLTGARKMQVLGAIKAELLEGVWIIPVAEGRSKNGEVNALRLGPIARDIFERRKYGLLFPSAIAGGLREWGWSKIVGRVRRNMERSAGRAVEPWSLHDLRRTVDTGLSFLGVDRHVIERVLGHKIQGITRHYRMYDFLDEKGDALLRWES